MTWPALFTYIDYRIASVNGNSAEGSTSSLEEYRELALLGRDPPDTNTRIRRGKSSKHERALTIPGSSGALLEKQGVAGGGVEIISRRQDTVRRRTLADPSPTRTASGDRPRKERLVQ